MGEYLRGTAFIVVILLISTAFLLMSEERIQGVESEGQSIMDLFAIDSELLTPMKVNETTLNFSREEDGMISNLPMIPFQWYSLGDWRSHHIDDRWGGLDMGEIGGVTTIEITLSCFEEVTMDLMGSFIVHSNPVVDSITLNDVTIGPEPETFSIDFDTEGIELEDPSNIGMRWLMRGGSDDIVIHLGVDLGTGLTTYINPLVVDEVYYYDGLGLAVDLYKPFSSWDDWGFDFEISIDDNPFFEAEHYYSISGGDEHFYVGTDRFYTIEPGDHIFRWEADYGHSSHSSGTYDFTIEEEPPIDDPDDEDPEDPPIDDDDDPPIIDDDDELWTSSECERKYSDQLGDEVTYWSYLDTSLNMDSGAKVGEDPRVDIKEVSVYRENDNLVIEIKMEDTPKKGIVDSGIWNTFVYFLDPDDKHTQPPMYLGEKPDSTEEDYEPEIAVASTSLFHSSTMWWGTSEVKSNSYIIKGTLESLMETGLSSDFEIFVKIQFTDLENFATDDSLNVVTITDYAGAGAWEVDKSLVYVDKGAQGNEGSDGTFLIFVISGICAVVILVVIVILTLVLRKNRSRI